MSQPKRASRTTRSAEKGDALFATVQAELPEWLALDEDEELSDHQRRLAEHLPHRRQLCELVHSLWPKTGYRVVVPGRRPALPRAAAGPEVVALVSSRAPHAGTRSPA